MLLLELGSGDHKSGLTPLTCMLEKHLLLMLRYPLSDDDEVWVVLFGNRVSSRSKTTFEDNLHVLITIEESLHGPSATDTDKIPMSRCLGISC